VDIDDIPIYTEVDKSVCVGCVSDHILVALVEDRLTDTACAYCGTPGAAPVEVILEAVSDAIGAEYTDPVHELPYESREGGYQGVVEDGSQLVWDLFEEWIENKDLVEDLAKAFAGTPWCRRHYFSLDEYEALNYGWEGFVGQVKHETRYLFLQELGDADFPDPMEIPPGKMLEALGNLVQEFALFSAHPEQTTFYRARVHDSGERLTTPDELGPPPRHLAGMSNRMSPAGIPMFYGAFDEATAVAETFDPTNRAGKEITIARFLSARPLLLLDLTDLPSLPSPFDGANLELRKPLLFLRKFVADLAKPIQRDGYEHVEYVPTQVVTEYFRHRFATPDGDKLDGIQFASSRDGGSVSVVLFCEQDGCGPRERRPLDPEILLNLEGFTRRRP